MKHTLLLLITIATTLTFGSCTGDGEQRFEIPLTISNFSVGALDPNQSWKTFSTEVVTNDISAALSDYGYSFDNVKKIEPKNITLTITSSGQTFNNIQNIDAFVSATGFTETKIAYSETIPSGATTLPLSSQYSDITEILKQPEFTFLVRALNQGAFGPATGTITFTVDVIAEK